MIELPSVRVSSAEPWLAWPVVPERFSPPLAMIIRQLGVRTCGEVVALAEMGRRTPRSRGGINAATQARLAAELRSIVGKVSRAHPPKALPKRAVQKSRRARLLDPEEPADWQERHSPTVPVTVRILGLGRATDTRARRRKDDADLMLRLSVVQMACAEELREAYVAIVGEVSIRCANYEGSVRGGRPGAAAWLPLTDLTTQYRAWQIKCGRRRPRVNTGVVLDVICKGMSCRAIDAQRGRRAGYAAQEVRQALTIWDDVIHMRRASLLRLIASRPRRRSQPKVSARLRHGVARDENRSNACGIGTPACPPP